MYEVIFYETEDGKIPVKEFLEDLEPKLQAKTIRTLELLEEYGPRLREPHSKYLGEDIFELRTKQSSNITRILYFFIIGEKIILTNGFIKKTQKTLKREIDIAKIHKLDFERRYKNVNS